MSQVVATVVKRLLAEYCELTAKSILNEDKLSDLLDSLDRLDFIFGLNKTFNIKLVAEDLDPETTVGELCTKIARLIK